jgi:predicted membrane protein
MVCVLFMAMVVMRVFIFLVMVVIIVTMFILVIVVIIMGVFVFVVVVIVMRVFIFVIVMIIMRMFVFVTIAMIFMTVIFMILVIAVIMRFEQRVLAEVQQSGSVRFQQRCYSRAASERFDSVFHPRRQIFANPEDQIRLLQSCRLGRAQVVFMG